MHLVDYLLFKAKFDFAKNHEDYLGAQFNEKIPPSGRNDRLNCFWMLVGWGECGEAAFPPPHQHQQLLASVIPTEGRNLMTCSQIVTNINCYDIKISI